MFVYRGSSNDCLAIGNSMDDVSISNLITTKSKAFVVLSAMGSIAIHRDVHADVDPMVRMHVFDGRQMLIDGRRDR
jgi:hypothetical protein